MFKRLFLYALLFSFLFLGNSYSNNLASCSNIDIELVASDDYLEYKKNLFKLSSINDYFKDRVSRVESADLKGFLDSVSDSEKREKMSNISYFDRINQNKYVYKNYISSPGDKSNNLFVSVTASDMGADYLSCGFESSEVILCDSEKLWNSGTCKKSYDNSKGVEIAVESCEDYKNANTGDKACYPEKHICNAYKEDRNGRYFSVLEEKVKKSENTSAKKKRFFYIYKKNINKGENCKFNVLQCDIKINNEYSSSNLKYHNVVLHNNSKANLRKQSNKDFIDNIFSGFDNKDRLFVYLDKCKFSDCSNYKVSGKSKAENVMTAKHYYKYVFNSQRDKISNNDIVYLYKIDTNNDQGSKKPKGDLCVGYLPSCDYLDSNHKPIYTNGNSEARKKFFNKYGYSNHIDYSLSYITDNISSSFNCLSRFEGTIEPEYKGYCSDLGEDGKLKYKKGLQISKNEPNCYLKSCIDLTPDELLAIVKEDKDLTNGKYCSEYYYLENSESLKYLPLSNKVNKDGSYTHSQHTPYCSDISKNKLKFYNEEKKINKRICKKGKNEKGEEVTKCDEISFSYGGGINSTRSNCYLKNCFSLKEDERNLISEIKVNDKAKAVYDLLEDPATKRVEKKDERGNFIGYEGLLNKETLKTKLNQKYLSSKNNYCISGLFFTNEDEGFKEFDYYNLNIIPCYNFSREQLETFKNNRMVSFKKIIGNYSTEDSKFFCRSEFKRVNKLGSNSESNFFENKYIGFDESELAKSNSYYYNTFTSNFPYKSDVNELVNYLTLNGKQPNNELTHINHEKLVNEGSLAKKLTLAKNICSGIENSLMYYDTSINTPISNLVFDDENLNVLLNELKSIVTDGEYDKCYSTKKEESGSDSSIYDNFDESNIDKSKLDAISKDIELDNKIVAACKKEHCVDNVNYCNIDNDIKEIFYGCEDYSLSFNKDTETTQVDGENVEYEEHEITFDCSMYPYEKTENYTGIYKKIFNNYIYSTEKRIKEDKENKSLKEEKKITKEKVFNSEDFGTIFLNCEESKPINYDKEVVEPDNISMIIKPFPFYNSNINYDSSFNSDAKKIHGFGNGISYLGCYSSYTPLRTKEVLGVRHKSALRGCKMPDSDSSYIASFNSNIINNLFSIDNTTSLNSKINNMYFEPFDDNSKTNLIFQICNRYNDDIYNSSSVCGQREGSEYKDLCFYISEKNEYFKPLKNGKYDKNDVLNYRFRRNSYGRNNYVYYDLKTSYSCTSSNYPDNVNEDPYYDEKAAGLVTLEGIANGLLIVGTVCVALGFIPFIGPILAGICSVTTVAISIGLHMGLRTHEYLLSLQNNIYVPNNYTINKDDNSSSLFSEGFLSKANIFDNNDYIYRYYPRSNNIEEDIKNKLEYNISNTSGDSYKRFFYRNTLEEDIIINCKLYNLFSVKKDEKGVKYPLNLISDKYKISGDCTVGNNNSVENCLNDKQIECLKSYGVSFFNKFDTGESKVDFDFSIKNGAFLKKYIDGTTRAEWWGTEHKELKEQVGFLPLRTISYTGNVYTKNELKNRSECILKGYGDSFGSLSKCRGFEYNNIFYTESQAIPKPLFTSPIFFYNLLTPRNTPEFFNPTLVLKKYGYFKDYVGGTIKDSNFTDVFNKKNIIVDFYNPKFKYSYDYINGVVDPNFVNLLSSENDFITEITLNNSSSYPHSVVYRSKLISTKQDYNFYIYKTSSKNSDGSYLPSVCLRKIIKIPRTPNNTYLDLPTCPSGLLGCITFGSNEGFISRDGDFECYDRAMPNLYNSFVMFPSKNMTYYNPVINVYLKPSHVGIKDAIGNEVAYALKQYVSKEDSTLDIDTNGESKAQAFGMNFERSYCSKAVFDYYNSLRIIKEENSKNDYADLAKISLHKKNISVIEKVVKDECYRENGQESEILINSGEIRTLKDTNDISKVVYKEVVKIKKYNELYGSFNEICLSKGDISNMLAKYSEQNNIKDASLPEVLTYRDNIGGNKDTISYAKKCVLNADSRNNPSCLVSRYTYIYCNDEDVGRKDKNCEKLLDITNNVKVNVRKINCEEYLGKEINKDNIREIQACFKGGYNMFGNIYKKPVCDSKGNCSTPEADYSCSCEIFDKNASYNNKLFDVREITAREYGLCVDLENPNVCPAVKYYGSDGKYVDDNLALNKTEEYLKSDEKRLSYYEQHLWRTNEKVLGTLPSVFFSRTLGNAEFPASVYCGADIKGNDGSTCFDSDSGKVYGECRGYWKYSAKKPEAICKSYEYDGKKIYEYELNLGSCERYTCNSLGYDSDGISLRNNERDIIDKESTYFSKNEVEDYNNFEKTDYTSHIHNEETSKNSIDPRGSSHGFATWQKTESGDFAKIITSRACLIGYGPAGSNIEYSKEIDKISESYGNNLINYNEREENGYRKLLNLYQKQDDYLSALSRTNMLSKFPKRICNQLGEWVDIWDNNGDNNIYTSGLIGKNDYKERYYYSDKESFWHRLFKKEEKEPSITGYCERLICKDLGVTELNYNVHMRESNGEIRKNGGSKIDNGAGDLKRKPWNHTGGAFWSEISAPRNNSAMLTNDKVSTADLSRNISNIFLGDSKYIDSTYKYLKKVYGRCQIEYGYYNRGTKILNDNDFLKQLNSMSSYYNNSKLEVNPREYESKFKEEYNNNGTKPTRTCNSNGLWDGVKDPCFRSCEMLNIYNTNIDKSKYDNGINLKYNENYFIDNHDIKSIDLSIDPSLVNPEINKKREEIFRKFQLQNLKEKDLEGEGKGFIYGDYLTGGATWPRSIVGIDNSLIENKNDKKGLRFVYVYGSCDSSYDDSEYSYSVRQFSINSSGKRPRRKCYEDGSWGPVEPDTRCVLYKSCRNFSFTLNNLKELIEIYNDKDKINNKGNINDTINKYSLDKNEINNVDNLLLLVINKRISKMISSNKGIVNSCSSKNLNNCPIYDFKAETVAGYNYSDNKLNPYLDFTKLNKSSDLTNLLSDSNLVYGYDRSEIESRCFSTLPGVEKREGYISGWNLKNDDLGRYFKPKTCDYNSDFYNKTSSNVHELIDSSTIRNRVVEVSLSKNNPSDSFYVKYSRLNLLYDSLSDSFKKSFSGKEDIKTRCFYNKEGKYEQNSICNRIGNKIENESGKTVKIGSKVYKSFQRVFHCNNEYYFNNLSEDDLNTAGGYYNKDVVFECSFIDGKDIPAFNYFSDIEENKKENNFIKVDNCNPRICGDDNSSYALQKGWKKSYITGSPEIISGSNSNVSELSCPSGRAFVINNVDNIKGYIDSYFYNKEDFSVYGFYTTIKSQCLQHDSVDTVDGRFVFRNSGVINGKSASSYQIARYGRLDLSRFVGVDFCKNKDKTDCKSVTEEDLINGDKFVKDYCVPMYCDIKSLKLIDGNIREEQKGGFSLSEDGDYSFGKTVLIQSYDGDYEGVNSLASGVKDLNPLILTHYDENPNVNNICPDGQDIYTDGVADYKYYDYLFDYVKSSERSEVESCFSLVDFPDTDVSGKATSGLSKVENGLYLKYNNSKIKKDEEIKNIQKMIDGISSLRKPAIEEEISDKIINRIVNTVIFNKSEYIGRNNQNLTDLAKKEVENILLKTAEEAKKATDNLFTINRRNELIGFYVCPAKIDLYKDVTNDEILNNEDLIKFKEIKNGESIFTNKLNEGYSDLYFSVENDNPDICSSTSDPVYKSEEINGGIYRTFDKKCLTQAEGDYTKELGGSLCDINESSKGKTFYNTSKSSAGRCFYNESIENYKGDLKEGESCNIYTRAIDGCAPDRNMKLKGVFVGDNTGELIEYSSEKWIKIDGIDCSGCLAYECITKKAENLYYSISKYVSEYERNYENILNNKKEELKRNIKSKGIEKYINDYEDNYNFYYNSKYYESIKSINLSSGNLLDNLFYDFVNSKIEDNSNISITIDSTSGLNIDLIRPNDDNSYKTFKYSKNINGLEFKSCELTSSDNVTGNDVTSSCSEEVKLESEELKYINNYYNYVFGNSLNDVIKGDIEAYKKNKSQKWDEELKACHQHYKNFIKKRDEKNESQGATFKSGFYMAMECTPKGWKTIDKPSCKSRCSGEGRKEEIMPEDGAFYNKYYHNVWYVKGKVENLRHNQIVNFDSATHGKHTVYGCSVYSKYTTALIKIQFNCNNGSLSYNAKKYHPAPNGGCDYHYGHYSWLHVKIYSSDVGFNRALRDTHGNYWYNWDSGFYFPILTTLSESDFRKKYKYTEDTVSKYYSAPIGLKLDNIVDFRLGKGNDLHEFKGTIMEFGPDRIGKLNIHASWKDNIK